MSGRLGKWLVAFSLVSVLVAGGCQSVRVLPIGNGPVADHSSVAVVEASGGPKHDLAVISLDFDPPLRVLQIDRASPEMTLLIAVDNKGSFTERQVMVDVELRSQAEDEVLLHRQQTLESIAPGEATIVKFRALPSIPPRSGYTLAVQVSAMPGETNLTNNATILPLQLILAN